jgi:hypothetical protein
MSRLTGILWGVVHRLAVEPIDWLLRIITGAACSAGGRSGRYRQSGTRLRNCGNPSERVEKWGYAMLLVITRPLSCAATYSD